MTRARTFTLSSARAYRTRRPILDRFGLKATPVGRTMNNLPPAAVYRVARRGPCRFSTAQAELDEARRRERAADDPQLLLARSEQ